MWAARYRAPRYWAGRYWAPVGQEPSDGYYWPGRYWGARYWPQRYWTHVPNVETGYYWGAYWAPTYWGRTYWAKQADTAPFSATVTAGLSAAATVTLGNFTPVSTSDYSATVTSGLTVSSTIGINATPQWVSATEFIAAAPLQLPTTTVGITIQATPELGFAASAGVGFYWAGRYWASGYWAPRYWQTQSEFNATVTSGLSMTATATLAGSVQQDIFCSVLSTLTVASQMQFQATPQTSDVTPVTEVLGGGWPAVVRKPGKKPGKKREEEKPAEVVVVAPRPVIKLTPEQQKKKRRKKEEEDMLLY